MRRPPPAPPRPAGRRALLRAALACGAAAALPLAGCGRSGPGAQAPAGARVVESRETRFGRLAVVEIGRMRYLAYGSGFDTRFMYESALDLDRPHELAAPYTRLMMLGLAYAEPCRRIVQVGAGAGNMTGYALRTFPGW